MKQHKYTGKYNYLLALALLTGCGSKEEQPDASGTFEATEIIVSAEATGVIKQLSLNEGDDLKEGQVVGYIDSTQLYLRKKQLLAQSKALLSRKPDISAQVAALEEQLRQARKEQQRIATLRKSEAATEKQVDDINAQVLVLEKQISATRSSLGITSAGLSEETVPVAIQAEQVSDQLRRCRIVNPARGTVLSKYAEVHEMAAAGKPLYKLADLSQILLRCYVTGEQLASLKTGQKVKVTTTQKQKTYDGTIEWISDKAEFTPKTIQTSDERANLVYAVKIRVKNDGYLKIGMYGDVKL
jgi:HlyD family secretion protein